MLTPRRKKIQKVSVIAEMVRTSIGKIGPKILPKNKKGAKILDPLKKKNLEKFPELPEMARTLIEKYDKNSPKKQGGGRKIWTPPNKI